MKNILLALVAMAFVGIESPSHGFAADHKNVLLICVDDLRPELNSFGKSYIQSPNIDQLAARGRPFVRHYVQAPTCGASRYTLLTGRYGPRNNHALFQRAGRLTKGDDSVPPSLPAWFRDHGYTTVSVGKVSHHPGGRGGADWDDPEELEMPLSWDRHRLPSGPWQHPRGAMHGLANGEIRGKASEMDVIQASEGPDSIYPDGLITADALSQMKILEKSGKPFFLAVGLVRPHLPFGAPAKYLELYRETELPAIPHPAKPTHPTTWHGSGEFMKYNRWGRNPNVDADFANEVRRHYAACVSYVDEQVGQILEQLDELALRDNTIVVLWGDHGWHLGEHGIWGKHSLFEESLRSPLIIAYDGIAKPGVTTSAIVETLDVFPTLCELAGVPSPDFLQGISLQGILDDPNSSGHPAIGYTRRGRTIRTDSHRLIVHGDGYVELYDHQTDAKETLNVAEQQPRRVQQLMNQLDQRVRGQSR